MNTITKSEKLLYSRAEAAQLLGIHPRTLDRLIAEKRLTAVTIGDRPMVSRSALERFAGVTAKA
ncbi:MAG TPA: helix-turn-helix domain-containing protein [Candidatus Eisenbacteria bacterium]|nr:helix-turn-helix domain-containing protein [Candidatus Eisenbacteria bacterium]